MTSRMIGGRTGAALLRAVTRNDLPAVQRLFSRRGRSLLHVHGADGCTPLLLACKKGHIELVKFFLVNGASVSDRDKDSKRQGNALHYACWGGNIELVRYFLDELSGNLNDMDIVGNTPLLYSVYGGHKQVVEELLRRGRSLREKNNKNHTVILQAACGGHLDLVEWLLRKGFSMHETDNDGNTALLFAAWGGHRELMEFLLREGSSLREKNHNGHSVFLSAANGGRVEVVEWLLTQGFDLDETNNNGDTALLLAAYGGHRRLVERLLELGASLDDKNGCGFTPLLSAANGGQLEMAAWLLGRGSSLSECDNDGYTSLILAACGGNIELVEFFLRRGASLDERNHNGDTALLLAAYCGHRELVEWLLDNGSKLTEKNNTGMGVLISAANGGNLDVLKFLLERYNAYGLEETDEGGYTPLLLAAQRGHLSVVQYLAAYGANIRARTIRHDNDAIALAVESPDVQEYLRQIWNFRPLQVAVEARLIDRVHAMLEMGVDPASQFAEYSPLQLAVSQPLTYPGAKAPCPELITLMRDATAAWSPRTHFLFGGRFRQQVQTVLLVEKKVAEETVLPVLPHELWLHIASFMQRSWFPEAHDPEVLCADSKDKIVRRRQYRSKRIFRTASEDEEPVVFSDMEEDITELELRGDNQCSADRNGTTGRVSPAVHQDAEPEAQVEERVKAAEVVAVAAVAEQTPFRVTWV